jgi:short-subunit dehydrogenase
MKYFLQSQHQVTGVVRNTDQRKKLLNEFPENLAIEVTDLAQTHDVDDLLNRIKNIHFDHILLNAGCADIGKFDELPLDSIHKVMQTNLISNMQLLHGLLPKAKVNRAKITMVSSIVARHPGVNFASYAVSKSGMTQLYKSLAVEYPSIDFLCLELGGIKTEFHKKANYHGKSRRKAPDLIGRRIYDAMLSKRQGIRTLAIDWAIIRRVLIMFDQTIVDILKRLMTR